MMASISSTEMRGQCRAVVLVAIPRVKRAERSGSRPVYARIAIFVCAAAPRYLGIPMVVDRPRSVTRFIDPGGDIR